MKIRVILVILSLAPGPISAQKQFIKDNVTYLLSAMYIGGQKNTLARDKGHIVFNSKSKSATCFTSCNFIRLKYSVKDKAFRFTSIVPDKQPCPDPLIGLESDFKENLPKVTSYSIAGSQLIFFSKKDTLMVFSEFDEMKGMKEK